MQLFSKSSPFSLAPSFSIPLTNWTYCSQIKYDVRVDVCVCVLLSIAIIKYPVTIRCMCVCFAFFFFCSVRKCLCFDNCVHALNIRQNYPTWDNDIHKRKPRVFQFFKRIMYCQAQFKTTFVVFVSKTATRKRKLHVIPAMSFVCSQWGEKSNIYCYDYRLIVTFFAHLKSISMCLCFYTIATITAVFLDSRVYSLYFFWIL